MIIRGISMNTRVFVADTTPLLNENVYNRVFDRLPAWRADRVARYKNANDRAAAAGVFVLLMHGLSVCLADCASFPEFIYGPHKKPYLPKDEGIYFNMSHSGDRVMCIIGDSENGCDIQKIVTDKDNDKIASRFFHQNEVNFLNSITDDIKRTTEFYKLWCVKESYLKYLGIGLAGELKNFAVDLDSMTVSCEHSSDLSGRDFVVRMYDLKDGYVCSAVARSLPDKVTTYKF